jgi:hypothetical protein
MVIEKPAMIGCAAHEGYPMESAQPQPFGRGEKRRKNVDMTEVGIVKRS